MKYEIKTARYMGYKKGPFTSFLRNFIQKDNGEFEMATGITITIRTFDWYENNSFIRPCDCHIGFDEWIFDSVNHVENVELCYKFVVWSYVWQRKAYNRLDSQ